jgi:hypothetical protein
MTVRPVEVPSPGVTVPGASPSAGPGHTGRSVGNLGIVVALIAVGVLATIWIRRAAARYRRSLRDRPPLP